MDEQDQLALSNAINNGFISNSFEPLKCEKCNSIEFIDKTTDITACVVCEYERYCKKCGTVAGYWAYGYWMP